jgi:hypothetical protein
VGESGWRAMSRSRSRISSLSSTFSGFAHGGGVFFLASVFWALSKTSSEVEVGKKEDDEA